LLVACASQDTEAPASQDLSQANRLFNIGFRDISDIYIDDVAMAKLAVAGLNGLDKIDPEVSAAQMDGRIRLFVNGEETGEFAIPARDDAKGWALLTTAALGLARARSDELDAADPEQLYELVFDGMLSELDRFSRYAGRDEALENRASRDGFGGIGVRIRLIDEGVRILSVMEDTPAEKAGLRDNDIITEIDGQATVGLSQRDVVRRLRGRLRSVVALTIRRAPASDPMSLKVVRTHIVPQTVRYARLGNVAHLRVSGFNQSTTRTLRDKMRLAREDIGPDLAGYILDLRGNPGGLLDQAITVSDLFVTGGRIVSTHGRHPDSHQYFDAEPDDLAENKPVVVLVNGNSASASEIVAAALQDSGRAVVVGTASFGKGTVQTVLRLPNEGELTLTWARFFAPSGYALNRRGVMPNICTAGPVTQAEDVVNRLLDGQLPVARATERRDIDSGDEPGIKAFRATCPPGQNDEAVDLEVARRLLENPDLFARALGTEAPNTAAADIEWSALAHTQ